MKRAGRIVHRLLSGLSLLLLLATAGVWVRSYWVREQLIWTIWPEDRSFLDRKIIDCSCGGVQLEAYRFHSVLVTLFFVNHFRHDRYPAAAVEYPTFRDDLNGRYSSELQRYAALGFEWVPEISKLPSSDPDHRLVIKSLTLPLYFPSLLFAILPAHYVLRLRRRQRIAKRIALGCCTACGYDLRASTGRCPECGRMESSTQSN